ncbi:MAG: hydrogenase maturation protease [Desulfobacteraceae bacterium]|nr:MAG: hydrogenase maturation protease [Desulfobacteraceae bacterium]
MMKPVVILGIGNTLFRDEGFGIHVIRRLQELFDFPEEVSIVDGGVLGMNLLGVISEAKHLIVVDVIRNHGKPGDLYRLSGEQIPSRIRAKNSLHQVDFLEALTLCEAIDGIPETVILGAEPQDIDTLEMELTPVLQEKVDAVLAMVLDEMDRIGVSYRKRS